LVQSRTKLPPDAQPANWEILGHAGDDQTYSYLAAGTIVVLVVAIKRSPGERSDTRENVDTNVAYRLRSCGLQFHASAAN
jgi:hypothetical protein